MTGATRLRPPTLAYPLPLVPPPQRQASVRPQLLLLPAPPVRSQAPSVLLASASPWVGVVLSGRSSPVGRQIHRRMGRRSGHWRRLAGRLWASEPQQLAAEALALRRRLEAAGMPCAWAALVLLLAAPAWVVSASVLPWPPPASALASSQRRRLASSWRRSAQRARRRGRRTDRPTWRKRASRRTDRRREEGGQRGGRVTSSARCLLLATRAATSQGAQSAATTHATLRRRHHDTGQTM